MNKPIVKIENVGQTFSTKSGKFTALRDINELLAHGVLRKSAAGGRSTSYELAYSSSVSNL